MRAFFAIIVLLSVFPVMAQPVGNTPEKAEHWEARFAIIDKLTATTHDMSVRVGNGIAHEKIEIGVRKCWVNKRVIPAEHAALVEIYQIDSASSQRLFSGWLFAAKSELTNLEHPAYDVQLLSCEKKNG